MNKSSRALKMRAMATQAKIPRRFKFEAQLLQEGAERIAGVDEAGRGPLAGPVVAAAVILPSEWILAGMPRKLRRVNDSKQLTAEEREDLCALLCATPGLQFAWAEVAVQLIDQINILQATHRAMNLALEQLSPAPQHVLVDGLRVKSLVFPQTPIVDGDCKSYSIAAASIVAKVNRDRLMREWDRHFPVYGFADHKGYATPAHLQAIEEFGPCPIHRQSFSPFRPVQTEMFEE